MRTDSMAAELWSEYQSQWHQHSLRRMLVGSVLLSKQKGPGEGVGVGFMSAVILWVSQLGPCLGLEPYNLISQTWTGSIHCLASWITDGSVVVSESNTLCVCVLFYLYLIAVKRFVCNKETEVSTSGSVATGRTSDAGWMKG